MSADEQALTSTLRVLVQTSPNEAETDVQAAPAA